MKVLSVPRTRDVSCGWLLCLPRSARHDTEGRWNSRMIIEAVADVPNDLAVARLWQVARDMYWSSPRCARIQGQLLVCAGCDTLPWFVEGESVSESLDEDTGRSLGWCPLNNCRNDGRFWCRGAEEHVSGRGVRFLACSWKGWKQSFNRGMFAFTCSFECFWNICVDWLIFLVLFLSWLCNLFCDGYLRGFVRINCLLLWWNFLLLLFGWNVWSGITLL